MTHPALKKQEHRPWPVPQREWKGRQSWVDLLFAHWPVPAEELRPLIPEKLTLQEFDGTAWIGVIPFKLKDGMVRGLPAIPGLSEFPELNLRTYVEYDNIPGVWFLSLDTTSSLAVWGARKFFYLPYFLAEMDMKKNGNKIHYQSKRNTSASAVFEATYKPVTEPYQAKPDSLEHWLTERYCLYSQRSDGAIFRVEIHHKPWPLQEAEAQFNANQLSDAFGITIPESQPLLHFSARQDVIVWMPERVA